MARSVELIVSGDIARSGPVEPGTWVAIFVSEDPEPHVADESARKLPPLTRILLPKVQVLGVVASVEGGVGETAEQAPRTILTIAVTQTEAEKVALGARHGDLTFVVRGDGVQVANRPGSTGRGIASQLLGSAS